MEYTVKHKTVAIDGVTVELAIERNDLGKFLIIQASEIVPASKARRTASTSIMVPEVE